MDGAARSEPLGWMVGVAADHPMLAYVVELVARGRELPALNHALMASMNRQHAEQQAGCTRQETLDLPRRNGAAAAGIVRRLTDEQLAARQRWPGRDLTVRAAALVEHTLIHHVRQQ